MKETEVELRQSRQRTKRLIYICGLVDDAVSS
jgi:hypothetical protein